MPVNTARPSQVPIRSPLHPPVSHLPTSPPPHRHAAAAGSPSEKSIFAPRRDSGGPCGGQASIQRQVALSKRRRAPLEYERAGSTRRWGVLKRRGRAGSVSGEHWAASGERWAVSGGRWHVFASLAPAAGEPLSALRGLQARQTPAAAAVGALASPNRLNTRPDSVSGSQKRASAGESEGCHSIFRL